MGQYTAEQIAASLARARALLAEGDAEDAAIFVASHAFDEAEAAPVETENDRDDRLYRYGIPLADPHKAERWCREQEELERKRSREKTSMTDAEWTQWANARIDDAIAELARSTEQAVAQVVAEERKRMRNHVAEQIGLLRAEFNTQRAAEKAEVLDLPRMQWKRHSAA